MRIPLRPRDGSFNRIPSRFFSIGTIIATVFICVYPPRKCRIVRLSVEFYRSHQLSLFLPCLQFPHARLRARYHPLFLAPDWTSSEGSATLLGARYGFQRWLFAFTMCLNLEFWLTLNSYAVRQAFSSRRQYHGVPRGKGIMTTSAQFTCRLSRSRALCAPPVGLPISRIELPHLAIFVLGCSKLPGLVGGCILRLNWASK